jgi:uncharacterized membrane protein YeaQ/YmgE (transglycosylase-associated protein family)
MMADFRSGRSCAGIQPAGGPRSNFVVTRHEDACMPGPGGVKPIPRSLIAAFLAGIVGSVISRTWIEPQGAIVDPQPMLLAVLLAWVASAVMGRWSMKDLLAAGLVGAFAAASIAYLAG